MTTATRIITAFLLLAVFILPGKGVCQLTVTPSQPAAILAAKLAGPGISIMSPTITCPGVANGIFISRSTPLTIDSGIILTTGKAIQASGLESFLASTNNSAPGDPALSSLAMTTSLYDACILQFDFVPKGDTVSFNYQFGSEEYNHSTCGPYNDAFAFFISGPGITGTQNMALVPGTTIPVTVNSVNSGTPGAGYTLSNCTAMGTGSPFVVDFYDNTGGTQLTYKGFTKKMSAYHSVTPCDTYHLKISICDAGNDLYDSGVFIEAGSLKTNSFSFSRTDSIGTTIAGVPHTIVKGCAPAAITVISGHAAATDQTVYFTFGGTAVKSTDYTAPDSAIITTGSDSVLINITGIPTPLTGTKTVQLYLSTPFSCGIVDSITLNIMDTPSARILTPDTTICNGASFTISVAGTPGLSYSWSPATCLSSATAMQPVASPTVTTTYSMSADLPTAGCPIITKHITAIVINTTATILTPDTAVCNAVSFALNVDAPPGLTYSWSPATGLSNPHIQDPMASPATSTTYTLTTTAPGGICPSTAIITVAVSALNVSILTPDTTICSGSSFTIRAIGPVGPAYTWSPATGLVGTTLLQPIATPVATNTYSLTASWPGSGCADVTKEVTVKVINTSILLTDHDTTVCDGNTVQLSANGDSSLTYNWLPSTALSNPFIATPMATPHITTTYTVTATAANGLCPSTAAVTITISDPNTGILTKDTTICKGASLRLQAQGPDSATYSWSPATGLSDPFSMQPIATPTITTTYTLQAGTPGSACVTTQQVTVIIATVYLYDVTADQTIPSGSSLQLNALGATYYYWTPEDGSLNNENINDPIATPTKATTYIVIGTDVHGCRATDSVTITLNHNSIFIPSAFTPDNDGLNDLFRIGNLGEYKLVNMSIFNRWGTLIYHTADGSNKGWDGTFNGTPQDMGVYNYLIIIAAPDGTQQVYKGNVTLIR